MAHGSLIKKTKKNKKTLPRTFAMAAHISQIHGDENHSEPTDYKKQTNRKEKLEDENGWIYIIPFIRRSNFPLILF